MAKWSIAILFLSILFTGCEKDSDILQSGDYPENEITPFVSKADSLLSDSLFGFARQSEKNEREISIIFHTDSLPTHIWLVHRVDAANQDIKLVEAKPVRGSDLYELTIKAPNQEYWTQIVVAYDNTDENSTLTMAYSKKIKLRHLTLPTKFPDQDFIRHAINSEGEVTFSWPFDTESSYRYLQLLTTKTQEYVSATTTTARFFRFYDRNTIRESYGPVYSFPTLQSGQTYYFALYAIEEDYWCRFHVSEFYRHN